MSALLIVGLSACVSVGLVVAALFADAHRRAPEVTRP